MNNEHGTKVNKEGIFKNTLVYMCANIGSRIMLIVVYPIYTFFLVPSDLGLYDLVISTLTLVYPVVAFSMNEAIFRWLLDAKGRENEQKNIISVGFNVALRNLLIIDAFFVLLAMMGIDFQNFIEISFVLNCGTLFPLFQQTARGLGYNKVFALSGLVYAIVLIMLSILLIVGLGQGITALFISQCLAYCAACIYIILFIPACRSIQLKRVPQNAQLKKDMVHYALMLIPNGCCWWIMNASDRYFIKYMLGDAANGIYAIAHKFPSVLNMAASMFSMAWQEELITNSYSEKNIESYSVLFNRYAFLLLTLSPILTVISKWFTIRFVAEEYTDAWMYSGTLYLGGSFLALAGFLGAAYLKNRNTKGSMITSLVGAFINIVADFVLMPWLGLEAASLSTLFGNTVLLLCRWIHTRKFYKLSLQGRELTLLILMNAFIIIVIRYTSSVLELWLFIALLAFFVIINQKMLNVILSKIKRMISSHN